MNKVILYLILSSIIYANDISYSFSLSNKTPYRDEGIILDANITQVDHSKVMFFKFSPKKSPNYTFHQIKFKEEDRYHSLRHHYQYLIYPKKEGNITIALELIKSLTDDDKVAYAISGDRDNVKGLVKKDIVVKINPLILHVKKAPLGTDLIGDFTLSYKLDKKLTHAYEPIHLQIELKGQGLIPQIEMLPKNSAYHLFSQKPKQKSFYDINGARSHVVWDYAISAKENFVLPKVVLKAFNPLSKKSYELTLPKQKIEVKAVDASLLVDSEDTPLAAKKMDWSWLGWLFSYVAVFIAGVLMPKDLFKKEVLNIKNDKELLDEKIAKTKNHKELLQLLIAQNDLRYKEAIKALESVLYHKNSITLNEIKRSIDDR